MVVGILRTRTRALTGELPFKRLLSPTIDDEPPMRGYQRMVSEGRPCPVSDSGGRY